MCVRNCVFLCILSHECVWEDIWQISESTHCYEHKAHSHRLYFHACMKVYLLTMLKGFMCEVHISCIFVCVCAHGRSKSV